MAPNKLPFLTRGQKIISVLIVGLMLFLAGCDNNSQSSSNQTDNEGIETADTTTNTDNNTASNTDTNQSETTNTEVTTAQPETTTSEPETPVVAQQEIKLVISYLRQGVQPNQHYVKVEEVLAGPTPCSQDSLLVTLDNSGVALAWQADDRMEILGAYVNDVSGCQISLNQATHTIKALPKPEPVIEAEPEVPEVTEPTTTSESTETREQPESLLEYPVRIHGTMSALRDTTAFFIVDEVVEGEFDCTQATVELSDPTLAQIDGAYEVQGLYDPVTGNCELRLVNPLQGVQLITPPVSTPVVEAVPSGGVSTPVNPTAPSSPFYLSAGVSLVEQIPVFSGSAGLTLTPELKGMASFGMGSGEVELALPSGEPITADVSIMLVEATGLYQVSGPFHVGISGGVMMLSGDYDLPYPVSGSTRFSATVPVLGAMVGYELGLAMLTLSVGVALGG